MDVAVVGVPFDSGVSYRPGARFGPAHIRQSSRLLRPYNPALDVLPFAAMQVVDAGDVAVNPFDIGEAIGQIEAAARELTGGGARLLTLGGDHTIALPLLRVMRELHGPVAVLHFDAHADMRLTYQGSIYSHACAMYPVSKKARVVQVGIRSVGEDEAHLVGSGSVKRPSGVA